MLLTSFRTSGGKSGASVRRNSLVSFSVPATFGKKPVWVVIKPPMATAVATSANAASETATVSRLGRTRPRRQAPPVTMRSPNRSKAAVSWLDWNAPSAMGFVAMSRRERRSAAGPSL